MTRALARPGAGARLGTCAWVSLVLTLLLAATVSAHAEPPAEPPPAIDANCGNVGARQAPAPATPPELVDLNRADERALLDLPGIGPARARAILDYRASHGGFRSLSQLLQIKGIGRSLLKQLRPLVTLSPAS